MKKKVGILSMQRVINYGSFLQAYALRQLLLNLGAGSVDFIDIIPGRALVKYESSTVRRYIKKFYEIVTAGRLIPGLKDFIFNRKLASSIESAWPMLNLDNPENKSFDMVIIGSDEVFNCCQGAWWGYSTQLFGDISSDITSSIISYAASFGYTTMVELNQFDIKEEISRCLSRMDGISVRDLNSQKIIQELIGQTPKIHLDPVLIYGYIDEIAAMTDVPMSTPYMIVYSYQGRISDSEEIAYIKAYAQENDLRLISIFCRYDWCDEAVLPETPIDVLRWFKFAECIVTDTFHGTIFSIITHSNFATFIRPSNKNKLHYLLSLLGLTCNEVNSSNTLSLVLGKRTEYLFTENVLERYRVEAREYLAGKL